MPENSPFPPGSRLIAYLRDSGGPRQELSVQRQRAEVERWCKEHSYRLERVFADEARTGTTTVGREDMFNLLAWLEREDARVDGVVVWEYERWSRDYNDAQFLIAGIRRTGVKFHSITNPLPEGAAGQIIEAFYLANAQQESEKLSRRIRSGLYNVIRRYGVYPHSRPPLGYRKTPANDLPARRDGSPRIGYRLEPDPDKAPLVKKAFELAAQGYTLREINEATGLVTFYYNLGKLLRNRLYAGILDYGQITVEGFCEPVISPELFDQVQPVSYTHLTLPTKRIV